MASKLALTLFLLAGVIFASKANRIVGGQDARIEDYPSIVQIESSFLGIGAWSHSCGANILTTRFVLTAAHCITGAFFQPEWRRIRAGSQDRSVGGQIVYIDRAIVHPSYGLSGFDGDVGLLVLSSALVYNDQVQQGTIVAQGSVIPDNSPVVHAGWGTLFSGGPLASTLQDVTIYTINNQICLQRYGSGVTANMICAGLLDVGGADACQGDSGGPLYYSNIIVGVVSWGRGCADSYYPGVSAAIAPYSNWIVEQVNAGV